MLSGISAEQIVGVLGISLYGSDVSAIYQPNEVEPVTINYACLKVTVQV
jgi:hypothetical protein